MISTIEIENFKAFGKRTKIKLAPITLIFGENSSGKSTILQSLNLLKQTRESREAGAVLMPRADHGIVDLGSFQELLFDHNLKKDLSIKVGIDKYKINSALFNTYDIFKYNKEISIELVFSRPSIDEEVVLKRISIFAGDNQDCLVVFEPIQKIAKRARRELFMLYRRDRRALHSNFKFMKCSWVNKESKIWSQLYEKALAKKNDIVDYLLRIKKREGLDQNYLFEDEMTNVEYRDVYKSIIDDAIKFYRKQFTLDEYIQRMITIEANTIIGIDGFVPYGVTRDSEYPVPEEAFSRSTARISNDFTLDSGRLSVFAGRILEQALEMLFPLGPFRRPPERWYIFTGTSPQDVGYKGELLPDYLFRNPELVDDANTWLDKLGIGYRLKIQHLGPRVKDLFEVRLQDTRRTKAVEVGLSDVGFGISQILPFIVQSLASTDKILSIEQPEVHIHPKLQADLGDLLAEAIKEPRQNQFIIETHSEHLILRLQKLIRDGVMSHNDISVVYVSRHKSGAKAQQLIIDSNGDFLDDWPGGFFPERLRELI